MPASCNDDGVCNEGEDCYGCGDCPGRTDGKPKNRYCCGLDGLCDEYNPILSSVLAEYQAEGKLLNAEYVDIFDVRFDSQHVNGGDCFHPSTAGHALMGEEQWCRSKWGEGEAVCAE